MLYYIVVNYSNVCCNMLYDTLFCYILYSCFVSCFVMFLFSVYCILLFHSAIFYTIFCQMGTTLEAQSLLCIPSVIKAQAAAARGLLYILQEPQCLPILWSHIPNSATVSYTSNIIQNDMGTLGPCSML